MLENTMPLTNNTAFLVLAVRLSGLKMILVVRFIWLYLHHSRIILQLGDWNCEGFG